MELLRTLSNNYIFRGVPRDVMVGLASLADVREYRGGDTVVRQFDRGSDLYIMLEGRATIRTFSGEPIAEVGPGSLVGEISLIDERPRSATVVSAGPSRAAVIPSSVLRGMMEADPASGALIMANIAKILCGRLRSMNVHVDAPAGGDMVYRA